MTSKTVVWLRTRLFSNQLNDWQFYHQRIAAELAHLDSHAGRTATVLDIGCGRGLIAPFPWERYPFVNRTGLDPDESARQNTTLQEFRLLEIGKAWPVASGSVDLAVARYVLEHLGDSKAFFDELNRVLKPDGRFVFLTPNKLHPSMLVASLLSHSLKTRLLGARGVDSDDVFPAFYLVNSRAAIEAAAVQGSLTVTQITIREFIPVGYLDFLLLGFLVSLGLYCLLRWSRTERIFGVAIVGMLEKRK